MFKKKIIFRQKSYKIEEVLNLKLLVLSIEWEMGEAKSAQLSKVLQLQQNENLREKVAINNWSWSYHFKGPLACKCLFSDSARIGSEGKLIVIRKKSKAVPKEYGKVTRLKDV